MVIVEVIKTANKTTKLHFKNLYAISGLPAFTEVFVPFMDKICAWNGADLTEMSAQPNVDTGFPSVDQIRWEFSESMLEAALATSVRFIENACNGESVYISR